MQRVAFAEEKHSLKSRLSKRSDPIHKAIFLN